MAIFGSLRDANVERCKEWEAGIDPGNSFYATELGGECGEVLNVVKKLERERLGMPGSRDTLEHLAEELADVIICVDLLAIRYGIDLRKAVTDKFNNKTDEMGFCTYIHEGSSGIL